MSLILEVAATSASTNPIIHASSLTVGSGATGTKVSTFTAALRSQGSSLVIYDYASGNAGTLAATVPRATATITGTQADSATLTSATPVLTAALTGTATDPATLTATTPASTATLTGTSRNPGTLTAPTPRAAATLAGTQTNPATMSAGAPAVTGSTTGTQADPGTLTTSTPLTTATLAGTSTNPGTLATTAPLATAVIASASVPPLGTTGNKIVVDGTSTEVLLRGANLLRSEWTTGYETSWEQAAVPALRSWGGNVIVRGFASDPVNSGNAQYLATLDEYVSLARVNQMYVVFVWRSDASNGAQPSYPDASARTALPILAARYRGISNVMFGLQVEPNPAPGSGGPTWAFLRPIFETMVDDIRAASAPYEPIVMVPGTSWSKDLRGAITDPVARSNIVYKTHAYEPNADYQAMFGDTYNADLPVFVGEFAPANGATMTDMAALISYAGDRGIGWAAWWMDYSNQGTEALVTSATDLSPTDPWGLAVRAALSGGISGTLTTSTPRATATLAGTQLDAGTLAGTAPVPTAAITGTSTNPGTLAASAPRTTAALAGTSTNLGTLSAATLLTTAALANTQTNAGTFAATTPTVTASLAGTMTNSGTLTAAVPLITASLPGVSTVPATLDAITPLAVAQIAGTCLNPGMLTASPRAPTAAVDGSSTNPASLTASVPVLTITATGSIGAPVDITVAGQLDPRRWAATLTDRDKTGTLTPRDKTGELADRAWTGTIDPRRWEGTS